MIIALIPSRLKSKRLNRKPLLVIDGLPIIIHTLKNQSEWNGGISNDSLFLSGSQTNWELLPVNWSNLESSIKHFGLAHYAVVSSRLVHL